MLQPSKFENIRKIATKLGLTNLSNLITKEEFYATLNRVVDMAEKAVLKNIEAVKVIEKHCKDMMSAMMDKCENFMMDEHYKIEEKLGSVRSGVDGINGVDGAPGKDGHNPTPEEVVPLVLEQIKIPTIDEIEKDLPKLSEPIRDALEILTGDDRLDKSAIKGLHEEIEDLKKLISTSGGQKGGFKKLRWISETPSGTVNSINTIFYLTTTPDPDNLLVMMNGLGQRNGSSYEYTLANKTITFNSAPPTGSQVFAWYSK